MSSPEQADIDESKLSGEDGERFLLKWLSDAEKDLKNGKPGSFKTSQCIYESILLKVISGASPYPSPGRPFRNLAARCLVQLYVRGDARTLFDTLQTLIKIVSDFKAINGDVKKIAAFYCIGELMAALGSSVMSFMTEIALVSLKTFRASSNPVLLRYSAILALRKSLSTAGKAVTEAVMKDILKHAKNALMDRSLSVQRAAADLLTVLYPPNDGTRSVADVESILVNCTKSLEGADHDTRRSLSRLVGHMLASTQTPRTVSLVEGSKKGKKEEDADGDSVVSPNSLANEAVKTILTPAEMFGLLSAQLNKQSASRKTRIGIFDFYVALITSLGTTFVEANYPVILKHFATEVICAPRPSGARDDLPLILKLVGTVLRELIGVRLLTEQGQIGAIQELSRAYLKKWPALMPGQSAPDDYVLVVALKEVAGLVQQLGNAPPPVQDALADPLVTLLGHPNHHTRVSAAWALRSFCNASPLRIPKIVLNILELLQRDMTALSAPATPATPPDIATRAIGHAYGLSALFAIIPDRPLYVSADLSAKVFDTATQLLRRAGEHDMHIATIEIEVAWTAIAALMSLGPNFVRAHLPQLLVLWRNALPKPTSKDTASDGASRSTPEWIFLLHVRACALGAVRGFLRHNSPALVTLDVARRVSSLLSNTLAFANAFVSAQAHGPHLGAPSSQGVPIATDGSSAAAREALLRRRVYQCFSALGFSSLTDALQMTLLQSTAALFASSEGYVGSALQAAIITSAGNFTSLWNTLDGYAYGVTTLFVHSAGESETEGLQSQRDKLNRDSIEAKFDDSNSQPITGSCEHDPLLVCQADSAKTELEWPEPPPPATSVVDSAVELFAALLPLQDLTACTKIVSEVLESTRSPKLDKNSGRKAAVQVNSTIAIVLALRVAMTSYTRQCRETLGSSQITSLLSPFLKDALIDGDHVLRQAASEALGRLASLSETSFLTSQVKTLVDLVVNNRDPYARAGCALAFGSIYTHVGGLAAGPLLKTTINVLVSLGNDSHPVVHYWALSALSQVVNAASLAYVPFVPSTLGMLFKIYLMETHEPEGGSVVNANMKGNHPVYQVVCQLIDAVVAALGPDIQESSQTRSLILNLVHEFSMEPDEGICVEAMKCMQHVLMFTPDQVDIADLVNKLRARLASPRRPLKLASINALYQLVQRDALTMSKLGGDKLVEELFGMLDKDPSIDGVRNVISSWLEQTVIYNPSAWIDLCQRIMARTTATQQASVPSSHVVGLADDEALSLSSGTGQESSGAAQGVLISRWRTQLFALRCLHSICVIVSRSGRREHLDIRFSRSQKLAESTLLVSRVPDLIKMAFTASATYVTEIRLEGLVVLRDVIEVFAKSRDVDYEESLLLEQYQAPITAALTPAFSSDSTPEILSSAVQVCAVFVGSGIVTDVGRMGRILKLLTSALEQSKGKTSKRLRPESGMLTLGDAGELSPNASVMLRISTLSAWAKLQVASIDKGYLKDVVGPYRALLASLWIAALRDYASIKGDAEVFQDSGSSILDTPYASLGREVLLPYYEDSWSVILHAIATAMKQGDPYVLAAMDGIERTESSVEPMPVAPREKPTALFFAIFGLAYEALVASSVDTTPSPALRANAIIALEALKSFVRPEYSGRALLDASIFDEFVSLCHRMAITEAAAVQKHLVEVITTLVASQDENIASDARANGKVSDQVSTNSPALHCLRICGYVLRNSTSAPRTGNDSPTDRIDLVRTVFSAFLSIGEGYGSRLREETRAVAVSVYADMLKSEKLDIDLVGPTLQTLKAILENPPSEKQAEALSAYCRLVHGLLSSCLMNIDEMRGRQGPISNMKITNNLLASVLILTVVPAYVSLSEKALEYCCSLICQKLLEKEVSLTAAHCAKTIILSATSGNPVLKYCIRLLLPGLVGYFASVAELSDDPAEQNNHIKGVEEVLKAFVGFSASVPDAFRSRALGIILPTITLLLQPSKTPPIAIHTSCVTQLVSLATSSPAAFKEATDKMDQTARETLELSMRQAIGAKTQTAGQPAAKPQISLRTF